MPEPESRIEPFTLRTAPGVVDDLRARLRATRWPDDPAHSGWSLGTDVTYLRSLVDYWATEFDWSATESQLNALPHRMVGVGDVRVHVIHARAHSTPALPLLLNHGWPDSSWRYLKVIEPLTDPAAHGGDPADAFDVIVPEMPGFGYSPAPGGPALNTIEVADLWAELMTTLGYPRFVTSGGDMGSHVSRWLALNHPDRVIAVHRTDAGLPVFDGDPADLSPAEREWFAEVARWGAAEGAYGAIHRTKPQTAAVGLTDSPAGMAAWIVEKLHAWSGGDGDLDHTYTRDEILTLLTQYWVTGTIGSSMRVYNANAAIPPDQLGRRVEVPSGFSIFGGDVVRAPREWLERMANIVRVTEPPRGGHFAAFEVPDLYVQEIRDFFRPFRDR